MGYINVLNPGPITVDLGAGFHNCQPPVLESHEALRVCPRRRELLFWRVKTIMSTRNYTAGKKITNLRRDERSV